MSKSTASSAKRIQKELAEISLVGGAVWAAGCRLLWAARRAS